MPARVVRPTALLALLALVALEGASAAAGEPTTASPPARDRGQTAAESKGAGPIVVWPTLTPAGDEPSTLPLHRPTTLEPTLSTRAQELDATLRDAVEDLGYTLDVADRGPTAGHMRDEDLIARAVKDTWVVSARLEPAAPRPRRHCEGGGHPGARPRHAARSARADVGPAGRGERRVAVRGVREP